MAEVMVLEVSPDAVADIAEAVRRARDGCLTARRPYLDQLDATARTLTGWSVGRVLATLEDRWHDDVARLVGHLGELADRLDQAAAAYRAGEQVSADRFGDVG
jgi:hypothetical protein